MDVYWLEQTEADVPAGEQWLSAGEMLCLRGLRFAKRRTDWRLGRWTAKRALAACLNVPSDICDLANIEVRATPSGAPEVLLFDLSADVTISLSHRAGAAICAVARSKTSLGCDLEAIEPRSSAFVADYFTVKERALVARTSVAKQTLLVTLCWSAKESALKALRAGLRLDTNCMDVSLVDDALEAPSEEGWQDSFSTSLPATATAGWRPLRVRYADAQVFHGWWLHSNRLVRTVVSALPLREPIKPVCFSSGVDLPSRSGCGFAADG